MLLKVILLFCFLKSKNDKLAFFTGTLEHCRYQNKHDGDLIYHSQSYLLTKM